MQGGAVVSATAGGGGGVNGGVNGGEGWTRRKRSAAGKRSRGNRPMR